jgi:subtilisin family serine protease
MYRTKRRLVALLAIHSLVGILLSSLPSLAAPAAQSTTFEEIRNLQPWAREVPAGQEIESLIGFVDTGCTPSVDPTGSLAENIVGGFDAVNNTDEYSPISTDPATYEDLDSTNHHGTAMTGIAASYLGVARRARILMARAAVKLQDGSFRMEPQACGRGIRWLVNHGAVIINCSWGGTPTEEIAAAIAYADDHDVNIMAAAGNEAYDKDQQPDCWEVPNKNVLRITASLANDGVASNVSWGHAWVDLAANVDGVLRVGTTPTRFISAFAGSSTAAAITTGVAGLLRNTVPQHELTTRLSSTVRRSPLLTEKLWTGGVLSPGRAFNNEVNPPLDTVVFQGKIKKNAKKLLVSGVELPLAQQTAKAIMRVLVDGSLIRVVEPEQDGSFSFVTKGRFKAGAEVRVQSCMGGEMRWNIP